MSQEHKTHFAILGAGPTGLEAALACAEHGHSFTLFEGSERVAGQIRRWGHVRLFTPWSMNASPRMRSALSAVGLQVPGSGDEYPTGDELVAKLLEPLADLPQIRGSLRLGARVTAIGRRGLLKHDEIGTGARAGRPFRLLMTGSGGRESVASADVVLDCTGNPQPNSLGDGGIPAPGEGRLGQRVSREVPNMDRDAAVFAGRTTLLVGAGHSAQTALRDLLALAGEHPGTRVVWVLRGDGPQSEEDDPLPERRTLTDLARGIADETRSDVVDVRRRRLVDALSEADSASAGGRVGVTLRGTDDDSTESLVVDHILSLTGSVGNHLLYRQLQVHECYATSGPMKLAAALLASSGASGDCLSQTSLGPETLRSPEPGFFILGSKSYGRRGDYLLRVGWQQVDEIFQLLD
ncbi:MAG: NAD(P)-binding protein [Thermoanaerobaculia bacterium]|nr:NAD(P)-binding protein [Thermoanaerobaculia bacterium]